MSSFWRAFLPGTTCLPTNQTSQTRTTNRADPKWSGRSVQSHCVRMNQFGLRVNISKPKQSTSLCSGHNTDITSSVIFMSAAGLHLPHNQFLVFPTAENLSECPSWHRPRASQIMNSHPSFVDFLVWYVLKSTVLSPEGINTLGPRFETNWSTHGINTMFLG